MITERQFYDYYSDFEVLKDGMTEKMMEAKKKNPAMDIDIPLQKINMLRRLQNVYHKMYHEQLTLDNSHGVMLSERDRLLQKIVSLEKENKELKENIRL